MTRFFVDIICRLYFRIEFEGVENVPPSGAMIMTPNHVSYIDPIWVSLPLDRPLRYMTWDKMVRLPVLGSMMRAYGAFPVNIDAPTGDRAALRHSMAHLRGGGGLMVFPEGGRTRDGKLMPFKAGVIRLALSAEVPLVPVTIIGGYEAYSAHHLFPRPYKLKIVYHKPITLTPPADNSQLKEYMREESERLRSIIASALPSETLPLGKQQTIGS
ncbi:MAG TPA: lysophospholipid acyltransferase family protein [Blastocatellia bacterium]|nr:lysophospholipid acyltransferase family protein [Blastocatellia bacterium]